MRRFISCAVALLVSCRVFARSLGVIQPGVRSREAMEALWRERVRGVNLARDRVVVFSPSPSYHLTVKGGTDGTDLVDGQLCRAENQAIWWDEKAVGWGRNRSRSNRIIIDLGEARVVDRVVWRVVAGCEKRGFPGPKRIRLSGSLDGKRVHDLRERFRRRDDLASDDAFHLPNVGPPGTGDEVYIYPIQIPAGDVRMRYVILEFELDGTWLASDELAVMAGSGSGQALSAFPSRLLQTKDVWVLSDESRYPLASGFPLPLFLRQCDLRGGGETQAVTYRFRLPAGVGLLGPPFYRRTDGEDGSVAFSCPKGGNSRRIGPFYPRGALTADGILSLRAEGEHADPQPWLKIELHPVSLPAPFRLRKLTASIGWMIDHDQMRWPDFETVYSRLGFNTIPTFPRGWGIRQVRDGDLALDELRSSADPAALTEEGRRLQRLRKAGFRVIYMESPFHYVNWRFPEAAAVFKCRTGGKPPKEPTFCPTYRGKYFQGEVQRVADALRMIGGADMVMWDWEIAGSGMWLGKRCSRCQAAFAGKALSWEAFVKEQTLGMMRALNAGVRDTAKSRGWQQPRIGLYNLDAVEPYSGVFDFPDGDTFDFQNSSLYVGDNPRAVHDRVRATRRLGGDSLIIPWLTTGTYGYVTPVNARIMVWEAFLNGAAGITYFCFSDMNPAHLVEINRALAAVASVEELIAEGSPAHDRFEVGDPAFRLSAMVLGDRAALLLVNTASDTRSTTWRWRGKEMTGKVTIPAGEAVLKQLAGDRDGDRRMGFAR